MKTEQNKSPPKPRVWEAVMYDDPRGQPVPYYRGLVCLVAHGPKTIAVVTKDGSPVPPEQWPDIANKVAAAPELLAALERWQEFAKNNCWTDKDHHDGDGTGWISLTDAAIAKARGQQ